MYARNQSTFFIGGDDQVTILKRRNSRVFYEKAGDVYTVTYQKGNQEPQSIEIDLSALRTSGNQLEQVKAYLLSRLQPTTSNKRMRSPQTRFKKLKNAANLLAHMRTMEDQTKNDAEVNMLYRDAASIEQDLGLAGGGLGVLYRDLFHDLFSQYISIRTQSAMGHAF